MDQTKNIRLQISIGFPKIHEKLQILGHGKSKCIFARNRMDKFRSAEPTPSLRGYGGPGLERRRAYSELTFCMEYFDLPLGFRAEYFDLPLGFRAEYFDLPPRFTSEISRGIFRFTSEISRGIFRFTSPISRGIISIYPSDSARNISIYL